MYFQRMVAKTITDDEPEIVTSHHHGPVSACLHYNVNVKLIILV